MTTINPYLNFPGTTEEAFKFYKSVFGGDFAMVQRFGETPEASKMTAEVKNKIMHISLPIGNGNLLMATDAIDEMGHHVTPGNNFYICISPDSKDEADRLYRGLSAGGKVGTQLQDMFWGAYYGDFTDKFGIKWMVNYTYPKK